jgi:hypothetical protein
MCGVIKIAPGDVERNVLIIKSESLMLVKA